MKKSGIFACTLFLVACQFLDRAFAQESGAPDPQLLGPRRQLTQIGPRSGEAYFSPDGRQLILQSERQPGNPFYQIYTLDLVTGRSRLVSTGRGKTTCAWFHPSMKKALFASTHLDPDFDRKVKEELETRKAPQKNKYSWSFDDTFDIFETDLKTRKLKRLTSERGYDAEGSYSPDGQWIAFASDRTGYTEKLSPEEAKLFEQDPSSQMEIYLMKSDGTQVKRLTRSLGYDGGPFFSADGRKITWRRFSPNGATAEIWTMNVDGSDQKAITRMGAMSWAPYFHPSGDYLVFTTNKLGFSNFELYIVDAEGRKEPVRVSYWDGFDGLPVFSPDGRKIAWTHKDEKGESQVYLATWDDTKARELLGLAPKAPRGRDLAGHYAPEDARRIVSYLASDELGGRMSGSPQERQMDQDLGTLMRDLGLVPFVGADYAEPFEFSSGVELGKNNQLILSVQGVVRDLQLEKDFIPLSFSKSGDFPAGAVAFAGYGLVAPASESEPLYDSYKDLDVKDKWVLVLRDIPDEVPPSRRVFLNQVSRLHHKALTAKLAGARGLLVASGTGGKSEPIKLRFDGAFAEAGIPVVSVSDDVANQLLKTTGSSLAEWRKNLAAGESKGASDLTGAKIQLRVDLKEQTSTGHNLLGMIRVPGARKTLVIGAHGDHLGHGEAGSSLAHANETGQVHAGADDNASGVAALLMIAQDLRRKMQSGEFHPRQNLLFAIWSGEEMGLLGSGAFLKAHPGSYSAYLNMDMVGRLRDSLMVQGAGSAREWRSWLEPLGLRQELSLSVQEDPYLPTDSMAFYMKGVPGLTFFSGSHPEYHSPRDRAGTLNYPGLAQVARLVGATAETLVASGTPKLTYQKVESSHRPLQGRSFRVYLGTIPDYSQEKIKGVRLSGTSKDSPAEKAGLLEGDVIKTLAGTKIENLYDYVYVLQVLKADQKVPIEIERQGRSRTFDITPMTKD